MMIGRRIWQKKLWVGGSRRLYAVVVAAAAGGQNSSSVSSASCVSQLLGFCSSSLVVSPPTSSPPFHSSILCNITKCCYSTQAVVDPPVGGSVDVPLAQTGEGIAECELLKWFVQEGDQVEEFQPLCEVQSDKATIEITSRYQGKVSEILYVPGDIVKVGETLLRMSVDSAFPLDSSQNTNLPGSDSKICDTNTQASVHQKARIGGALSTPAVRNLAKEYGININDVCGTGTDGRLLKEDVFKYAAQKGIKTDGHLIDEFLGGKENKSYTSKSDGLCFEDKIIPLRGFQRAMVKSMTMAAKVPHFHYIEEINCEAMVNLKSSFQSQNSDSDIKYTFLPILIKSLSMAFGKYPMMNSCFIEETQEVILRGSHNIGIAMATPHGLVVPNIKNVQSLSILEVTRELSRLQHLALENKLTPEDITGGTITLSNIGAIGGQFGSPLLNLPEVAIIAMGRIRRVPRYLDDENVYPASIMTVNIGADHRLLDGATVARFCNEWKQLIENPELLILHMR
ncbi:2-oxoacid dehydrogenase acyltransferase, catalytic domain [Dillenia turbinata]|uniref:Dihydrolipoamide acetyltransferase component of pyruvate dehydrogenase complex n=1 Tax=Dillenia turbinata TaxID=194707 RepID=A0AAN8UGS6_9MAGN